MQVWCCWQLTLYDPHLSTLEVRFSRRGAIQIDVYLYSIGEWLVTLHTAEMNRKHSPSKPRPFEGTVNAKTSVRLMVTRCGRQQAFQLAPHRSDLPTQTCLRTITGVVMRGHGVKPVYTCALSTRYSRCKKNNAFGLTAYKISRLR